ncbi:PD-(D/E)XK nuclease superfamily [uncultured Caudovirales phage]|uniref:PD-(D/E)XK nuclease superfamily n=1 Tax=uncultured Caudovirales phage TaxID=2100421 RepID=A0A6J5LFI7_9CAUD|nr:PD-(D/E)XK nuclease superfamily [uncultured Caudovirales phage]
MAKIPEPVHTYTTATAIVQWYEKKIDEPRPHLGASEIGRPCDRALWLDFRWVTKKKFSGRIKRLFDTGFREEVRFLEELRGIGAEVYDRDPETKRQHSFKAVGNHFGGSCDAIGRGFPEAPKTWCIVEFKTHGEKSFNDLVKNGVEQAKPEHYAQMQVYMGLAELDRALYLAVNKNTDELHSEWIHFDKSAFTALLERAEKIIYADEPPAGISIDPAWYQCKLCDHRDVCFGEKAAMKSCRTCVHVTPINGGWRCDSQTRELSVEEQRVGCRSHLTLPSLVGYAEAIDGGEGFIKYQHKDNGLVFANCTEEADRGEENMGTDIVACFTSSELAVAVRKIVADNEFAHFKSAFPDSRLVESSVIEDEDIPL